MKHAKQMLTAGVLTATILGGGVFALSASAQSSNSDGSLASKIASKFNLNKDEVQSVLNEHRDEQRSEHKAEHQKRMEERLSKAVESGKLTEDQKTKILEYLDSQESFFSSLVDKTQEERKQAIEKHREEVKKWATDNNIPEEYVLFGGKMGGHHGRMGSDNDGHMGPEGGMRVEE